MTLLLALTAQASLLKATWSASSSEPPTEDASYDVSNLGDGKQSNAWFEGVEGSGLGEWVQADLGGPQTVAGARVWAGWWYTKGQWGHYNRPKVVVVELGDGTTQEFTLADTFEPQELRLSAPKTTQTVRFKMKSVYSSDAYNDTAISEIQLFDGGKELGGSVNRYAASSTYPADSDGSYELRNTTDSIGDSLWCEGNKAGDGTGEWVEYGFAAPATVSRLVLRNGNASSFGLYMKSNRATGVTLTFGDGSTAALTLKDTPGEQILTFPARTTDKVRIRFDTVKKGTEFNDMCVAEAQFR